ncbi:MAG: hypothetical protein V1909_04660 [Candidatus Micrarchaeota archaeon]
MFEQLRRKFKEIASLDPPFDIIKGPKELMELAKTIGASELSSDEKEMFFDSLKDECLAEYGHVSEEKFNEILDNIEKKRTGQA